MRSLLRSCALVFSVLTASTAFAQPCDSPPVIYPEVQRYGWVPGDPSGLYVWLESSGETEFQWRRNGVALVDDGRLSGSRTETLALAYATSADEGTYDVIVTNACGQTVSNPVEIVVSIENCWGGCWCDINQDGGIDGSDVEYFFNLWESASNCADTNRDGGVDGGDVEHYICAWEMCCC